MVFDVESIGLHGEGFAVGWTVVGRDGRRVASAQYACEPDRAAGAALDRRWIAANVPVPGQGYNCSAPRHVRTEFWEAWVYAKARGAVLVADCPWPVEAKFLADCIADDPTRAADGPYPLIDVASVRLAAGLDPLATVERLPGELPKHDPLRDAFQSARLLLEALDRAGRADVAGLAESPLFHGT